MTTFKEAVVDDLGAVRRRVSRMENAIGDPPPSDRELMDARDLASRMEPLFASLEMYVPTPGPTQSYRTYRADLLSRLQTFVPDKNLSKANLHALARRDSDAIMDHFEREIVSAAKAVADDPTQGSWRNPGQLRQVEVQLGDRAVKEFRGEPRAWMQMFMHPWQIAKRLNRHPDRDD